VIKGLGQCHNNLVSKTGFKLLQNEKSQSSDPLPPCIFRMAKNNNLNILGELFFIFWICLLLHQNVEKSVFTLRWSERFGKQKQN
jgi:hypothetical protein